MIIHSNGFSPTNDTSSFCGNFHMISFLYVHSRGVNHSWNLVHFLRNLSWNLEILWNPMEILKSYEKSWNPMEILKSYKKSWNLIKILKSHEKSWNLMRNHEILCEILKSYEKSWNFTSNPEIFARNFEIVWEILLDSHLIASLSAHVCCLGCLL